MMVRPLDVSDVPISTVEAANGFGLDLFQKMYITAPGENWVVSPASLWFVLSMAIGGARGSTLDEMRHAMKLGDDYSLVDLGRLRAVEASMGLDQIVRIGNLLAVHDQYHLLPTFVNFCKDVMGAEAWELDFGDQASADRINSWISDVTSGKIIDLVQGLSPADKLMLVNAVYLKAQWKKKFTDAVPDEFDSPGGKGPCQMMHKTEDLRYTKGDGWQAVKIPYTDNRLSMMIVLPDADVDLQRMVSTMDLDDLKMIGRSAMKVKVNLQMPRFKVERTMAGDMMQALKDAGMKSAFGGGADFSAMSGVADLFVSQVVQKAVVEVDEVGTEAAAATAMTFMIKSATVTQEIGLRIDRPFFYSISDDLTGLVLFNGVVNRP